MVTVCIQKVESKVVVYEFQHKKLDGMSLVDENYIETIFRGTVGKSKGNIGCVYRAPNTDIKWVNEHIKDFLDVLKPKPTYTLI